MAVLHPALASEGTPAAPQSVADAVSTTPAQPSPSLPQQGGPEALEENAGPQQPSQKKKKKKKAKKSAKPNQLAASTSKSSVNPDDDRPPVLCISRNKHWRYISSYHGPWLQLPLELLESLLILNLDPATLSTSDSRPPPALLSHTFGPSRTNSPAKRTRGFASIGDHTSPDSPHNTFANLPPPPPLPPPKPGKATPPPIDPGVFRSVSHIRRLIDEASELSVRASSGLSAAALGSLRGGGSMFGQNPWGASGLGMNGLNDGSNGRNVPMSATRIHRLRALAVQKLAAAYKLDEIASSVMVMQGGSVFDDIAERVLKVDPNDVDARYVHFFHEKIPSRSTSQLAESTTTQQLDQLIAAQPQRLEFYRTRGIVHCFRDEYTLATKDFTHAIRESRAMRRANFSHRNNNSSSDQWTKTSKKKRAKAGGTKTNGQAPPNGTGPLVPEGPTIDGPDGEPLLLHPSVLPDAPDPIEPQCLFLRGAAYLQHAVYLIEEAMLKLEGVRKVPSIDGAELRLCYVENGKYGGTEIGNPEGPLGSREGPKLKAYRQVLSNDAFKDQINSLLKKSLRDHEKFLSHFDTLEGTDEDHEERNLAQKAELAFHLCENLRPNGQYPPPPIPELPVTFTTYHPLLVESHFSVLICLLMLGEFATLVPTFARTALLVDGLEGYPVFLPPRSMSQAEFVEVLERLAGGWKNGVQPHSLSKFGSLRSPSTATVATFRTSGGGSRLRIDVSPTAAAKAKEVDRAGTPPTPASSSLSSEDDVGNGWANHPGGNGKGVRYPSSVSATNSSLLGINGSSSSSSSHSHNRSLGPIRQVPSSSSLPSSSSGRNTPTSVHDFIPTPTGSPAPMTANDSSNPSSVAITVGSSRRGELVEALDYVRMLLCPVATRQKERAEKLALDRVSSANGKKRAQAQGSSSSPKSNASSGAGGAGGKKKGLSINIPLHGPRVEILLAWLAAVHLAELDSVV